MTDPAGQQVERRERLPFAAVAGVFYLAMTLGMFGDVLWSGGGRVLSAPGQDMASFNLPMREYGFGALRRGRLPWWNPHVYGGTPFAANVQAALFYPPNWMHLFWSPVTAVNVGIAAHFFLAAWLTAMWAHRRTGSAAGSMLTGAVFACSGGYFLHLYPGHVTMLHAAAWLPGLFLCVDRVMGIGGVMPVEGVKGQVRWAGLTAVMVAMPLLAGHPQITFYGWLTAGLYVAVYWRAWWGRWTRVATLGAGGALGIALAAVQLLPALALAGESTRAAGMTAASARQYALPWENLLTAIYPHLFGASGAGYVGRWSLWEVSIFAGAVAVVLAGYAAVRVPKVRGMVGVVGMLVLLAGVVPVVQEWVRVGVPGYAWFRAAGRFGLVIDLLVAVLAAEGLAEMVRRGGPGGIVVAWCAAGAGVSAVAAIIVTTYPPAWQAVLGAIERTGESYVTPAEFADPAFVRRATRAAAMSAGWVAGVLMALGVMMAMWRRWPRAVCAVVALGCLEVFAMARGDRASGPPELPYPANWAAAIPKPPGRVMTVADDWANVAMRAGFDDAYGYDPTVLRRYAMFLAATQGEDGSRVDFVPKVRRPSPLLALLRAEAVLYFRAGRPEVRGVEGAMPRFTWMHQYQVCSDVREVYAALGGAGFPFRTTALLESAPVPAPVEGTDGTVRVVRERPEEIEVEATTPVAAILLMTDAYAPGWGVRSDSGKYDLMPADGALRAIPLAAGRHHFTISYVAPGFGAGAIVSVAALVALVGAGVVGGRAGAARR